MPSASGVYSLPLGYLAVTGQTIQASQHNPPLEDIAAALTGRLSRDGTAPMLGVLRGLSGTAAAPGYTFAADATLGFFKSTNGVGVAVGGLQVAEFGAAGLLSGIASAALADKLITLQKLYHPSGTSLLLGTDSNAALTIIAAASNGGPNLIRLSVASTSTFATGQKKTVSDVTGTTEANGTWTITVVDGTHIDLQGSAFSNAYVSGGTIGGGVEEITLGNGLQMSGSVLSSNILTKPQGRLTLTSGTPVLGSDVISATSLYYTPYEGNLISIYNGTSFSLTTFAELTMGLVASHLASAIYDCFVINDAGTIRLVTGPAWNTATAGSGARGTGAGTTELQRLSGQWTNKNSMTGRYGSSTVAVAANQGTYVGSIVIDAAAGQVTCHTSYGQSRKWGVWNAYNRKMTMLKAGDATGSWNYSTSTYRASNNNSANSLTIFAGLPEEYFDLTLFQNTQNNSDVSAQTPVLSAIGYNSTTAIVAEAGAQVATSAADTWYATNSCFYVQAPIIGISVVNAVEKGSGNSNTYNGTEAHFVLAAKWQT